MGNSVVSSGKRSIASSGGIVASGKVINGEILNRVKQSDTDAYVALIGLKPSLLREIIYYQSGLSNSSTTSSAAINRMNCINPKSILNHDFLVIVMLLQGREHFFQAEKVGGMKSGGGEDVGIVIRSIPDDVIDSYGNNVLKRYACEDTPMDLHGSVMKILEEPDPDYSFYDGNCWKYAVRVTKKLLMECHRVTGNTKFSDEANGVEVTLVAQHGKDIVRRITDGVKSKIF